MLGLEVNDAEPFWDIPQGSVNTFDLRIRCSILPKHCKIPSIRARGHRFANITLASPIFAPASMIVSG
jgi:hypothetical protein